MASKVNGFTVGYTVAGAILLWTGITSKTGSIPQTLKSVIGGNLPNPQATSTSITPNNAANYIDVTGASNASESQWVNDLLTALGSPATSKNVSSVTDWIAHEKPVGDWSQWNNPLNTSQMMPGSILANFPNNPGVQIYPDLNTGLQATVVTLNNGLYGDILMMLKSGQGLLSGASQGLSTWSDGGYSSV